MLTFFLGPEDVYCKFGPFEYVDYRSIRRENESYLFKWFNKLKVILGAHFVCVIPERFHLLGENSMTPYMLAKYHEPYLLCEHFLNGAVSM